MMMMIMENDVEQDLDDEDDYDDDCGNSYFVLIYEEYGIP